MKQSLVPGMVGYRGSSYPRGYIDNLRVRQQAIGVRLRWMFDELIMTPVPQEWLDLLREADRRAAERENT